MDVGVLEPLVELGLNGLGLRDPLRLQAILVEHVEEVRVAAGVELVGLLQPGATVADEAGEGAVDDGGPDLALDVVADDRDLGVGESLGPLGVGGDEDGDAVHHGGAGLEAALGVELGGLLGSDGEVADRDLGPGLLQGLHDVDGLGVGLTEGLGVGVVRHVGRDPVVDRCHLHGDARLGELSLEDGGVVGLGEDGLFDRLADFALVDVEGGDDLDVLKAVAADVIVHESRRVLGRMLIELEALDERARAVADADDGQFHLFHGERLRVLAAVAPVAQLLSPSK